VTAVARSPLVVPVTDLLRRPGSQRELRVEVPADDLAAHAARVTDGDPVVVDVVLESLSDGITVHGTVRARWVGSCRRCLGPAGGELLADVQELYQRHPVDEDAFAFDGDHLDLRPMVRELVIVELPIVPLCGEACRGLCPVCGADRNVERCGHDETPVDVRWSALDVLRERLPESS
jgi:uncharacterized protein